MKNAQNSVDQRKILLPEYKCYITYLFHFSRKPRQRRPSSVSEPVNRDSFRHFKSYSKKRQQTKDVLLIHLENRELSKAEKILKGLDSSYQNKFNAFEKCIEIGLGAKNLKEKLLTLDDKEGTNTFLLKAVKCGKTNVINELIDRGANINEELGKEAENNNKEVVVDSNYFPWTLPLHYAVYHGQAKSTEILLKNMCVADTLKTNAMGLSVLHAAMDGCRCEDYKLYNRINSPCNHVDTMQLILKHGEDSGVVDFLRNHEKETPKQSSLLRKGIDLRSLALLRLYLWWDLVPNINQRFTGGETALHVSARNLNLDALKLLIEHKADIGLKDDNGYSALHTAIRWNHESIVKYLLTVIEDDEIINDTVNLELVSNPVDDVIDQKYDEEDCSGQTSNQTDSNENALNENSVYVRFQNISASNDEHVYDDSTIAKANNNAFTPIQMAVALQNWNVLKILVSTKSKLNKYSVTIRENLAILSACRNFKQYKQDYFTMLTILAPIARDINEGVCPGNETVIHFAILGRNPKLIESACRNPNVNPEAVHESKNQIQRIILDHRISNTCKHDYFIPLLEAGASPNVGINLGGSTVPLAMWVPFYCDKSSTFIKVLLAGAHTETKATPWYDPVKSNNFTNTTYGHWQLLQKLILVANCRLLRFHGCLGQNAECQVCAGLVKLPKLQNLARATIRNQLFKSKDIDLLPLPKLLKEYLYLPELIEYLKPNH